MHLCVHLVYIYMKGGFTMYIDKTRTSLTLPTPLYDLLDADSKKYGIAKSSIVAALLLIYYRDISSTSPMVNDDIMAVE